MFWLILPVGWALIWTWIFIFWSENKTVQNVERRMPICDNKTYINFYFQNQELNCRKLLVEAQRESKWNWVWIVIQWPASTYLEFNYISSNKHSYTLYCISYHMYKCSPDINILTFSTLTMTMPTCKISQTFTLHAIAESHVSVQRRGSGNVYSAWSDFPQVYSPIKLFTFYLLDIRPFTYSRSQCTFDTPFSPMACHLLIHLLIRKFS